MKSASSGRACIVLASSAMLSARLRLLLLVTIVVWAGLLSACQSPTLPLPPPSEPDYMTSQDGDYAEIIGGSGTAIPDALVMIFNADLGRGVIVTAGPQGEFTARIPTSFAETGYNTVEIWQRHGRADSTSITKLIHERPR